MNLRREIRRSVCAELYNRLPKLKDVFVSIREHIPIPVGEIAEIYDDQGTLREKELVYVGGICLYNDRLPFWNSFLVFSRSVVDSIECQKVLGFNISQIELERVCSYRTIEKVGVRDA